MRFIITDHGSRRLSVADETITADVLRARAKLAGITLDEDTIEDLAFGMEQALAPLRKLDLRAIRLVEPAITFRAAWSE
jgi:hypothetical protein